MGCFIRVSQGSSTLGVVVDVVAVVVYYLWFYFLTRWKWCVLIDEKNMAPKFILSRLMALEGRSF